MSNICKTVTQRTRKIKKGTQLSFYLDYYPGYRDESTMKVQRHESLGIYIFAKPKNQREKDYNDRMTEKAEALRCRRYESIVNERYDFFDREKEKGNFLAWFKKKADARNTKWQNVYKYFEAFCEGKCTFGVWQQLSESERTAAFAHTQRLQGDLSLRSYLYVYLRDKEWVKAI